MYVKMDQHIWVQGDYTGDTTYDLSGAIYRDSTLTTLESDLDDFTLTFKFINMEGYTVYSNPTDITGVAAGTFTVKFAQTRAPDLNGLFFVRVILEKSGSRLTAIGVNGSDRMFIDHN